MALQPFKKLLSSKIRTSPIGKEIELAHLIGEVKHLLTECIGVEASKRVDSIFLKNNVLTIDVTSAAVAQEIMLHRQRLLEQIRARSGARITSVQSKIKGRERI